MEWQFFNINFSISKGHKKKISNIKCKSTVYKAYNSGSTFFDTAIQQKYTEIIDTTSSTSFLDVMMPNVILNSYSAISFSSSTIIANTVSYDVITINNDNGNKIGSFNLYNGCLFC